MITQLVYQWKFRILAFVLLMLASVGFFFGYLAFRTHRENHQKKSIIENNSVAIFSDLKHLQIVKMQIDRVRDSLAELTKNDRIVHLITNAEKYHLTVQSFREIQTNNKNSYQFACSFQGDYVRMVDYLRFVESNKFFNLLITEFKQINSLTNPNLEMTLVIEFNESHR